MHFLISLQPTWLNAGVLSVLGNQSRLNYRAVSPRCYLHFSKGRSEVCQLTRETETIDRQDLKLWADQGKRSTRTHRKRKENQAQAKAYGFTETGQPCRGSRFHHKGRKELRLASSYHQPSFSRTTGRCNDTRNHNGVPFAPGDPRTWHDSNRTRRGVEMWINTLVKPFYNTRANVSPHRRISRFIVKRQVRNADATAINAERNPFDTSTNTHLQHQRQSELFLCLSFVMK